VQSVEGKTVLRLSRELQIPGSTGEGKQGTSHAFKARENDYRSAGSGPLSRLWRDEDSRGHIKRFSGFKEGVRCKARVLRKPEAYMEHTPRIAEGR